MTARIIWGFFLAVLSLSAEPRTFTDQFGRTVTAELIGVEGDQVRIRRDDGQVFTLSAAKLSEEDRAYVDKWAKAQPAKEAPAEEKFTPDAKRVVVTASRGKFDSTTLYKYESYTHKHERWGYSIQVTNNHLRPLQKIRVEYNLFARTYYDISGPTVLTGSKTIDALASRGSDVFRTLSAEVCTFKDTGYGYRAGGEMRGIWYRVYVDGQLLIEQASPESLMQTERWTKIQDES